MFKVNFPRYEYMWIHVQLCSYTGLILNHSLSLSSTEKRLDDTLQNFNILPWKKLPDFFPRSVTFRQIKFTFCSASFPRNCLWNWSSNSYWTLSSVDLSERNPIVAGRYPLARLLARDRYFAYDIYMCVWKISPKNTTNSCNVTDMCM